MVLCFKEKNKNHFDVFLVVSFVGAEIFDCLDTFNAPIVYEIYFINLNKFILNLLIKFIINLNKFIL